MSEYAGPESGEGGRDRLERWMCGDGGRNGMMDVL